PRDRACRDAGRALSGRARDGASAQAGGSPGRDRARVRGGHRRAAVTVAYVGLGANLGDREKKILRAAELIEARRLSTVRETEPWGLVDQPRFLNAVAELDTKVTPRELLDRLLEVERTLGRVREGPRWGPRAIDLDLLLYGARTVDEPGLHVPHPRLHERLFVLEPLAELAPDVVVPGLGTVSALLTRLQSRCESPR